MRSISPLNPIGIAPKPSSFEDLQTIKTSTSALRLRCFLVLCLFKNLPQGTHSPSDSAPVPEIKINASSNFHKPFFSSFLKQSRPAPPIDCCCLMALKKKTTDRRFFLLPFSPLGPSKIKASKKHPFGSFGHCCLPLSTLLLGGLLPPHC